jgi:hypothetical protein
MKDQFVDFDLNIQYVRPFARGVNFFSHHFTIMKQNLSPLGIEPKASKLPHETF